MQLPKPKKKKKVNYRQKALAEFQKWIRLTKSNSNGYASCFTCGSTGHYKKMDGGHYISRANRITELEPENVWVQCKRCNQYLSGNVVMYRINLLEKIGEERVDRLENLLKAHNGSDEAFNKLDEHDKISVTTKKSNEHYHEIYLYYKSINKELARDKGDI